MTLWVDKLAAALGELERLYRQLADTEAIRSEAIRRYDTAALAKVDVQCGRIAKEIEAADALRRDAASQLGKELGIPGSIRRPPRLVQLADRLDGDAKQRLLGLHAILRQRIEAVREHSSVNAAVTEKMLRHFHRLLTVVAGGGARHKTYAATGRIAPANGTRLVNQMA